MLLTGTAEEERGVVRDEEWSVGRKKPGRKAEPESKRGITWPRWTGFRGMTVRDWLQLLIVPFALAVVGFWFTMQQDARQQEIEDRRAQQAQKIENQREIGRASCRERV